jgi:hypothetical protein
MTSKYLWIVLLCLAINTARAQKAEQIYSHAQVVKPNEFYLQQMALWKKVLDKDKTNAGAWLNYYRANRYAHITGGQDSMYARNRFQRMEAVVSEIEKNIPGTYEMHFVKWANGYNDWKYLPDLKKAYALDSTRTETYDGFINLYEVNRDMKKRDEFLQKWYTSGTISPGLLLYNYNVLQSLKPDAILITAGDNDTYFAWMLQAVHGIRKDVTIVNVGLASMKEYSERLSKELGVSLPNTEDMKYEQYVAALYQALVKNKAGRTVYAGLTVDEDYMKPVAQNLYLVGLAYEYNTEKMDNIALLKKNFEQLYALDYIDKDFSIDPYASVVACANTNYIVPMLTLYNHYKLSNEMERALRWKEKAKYIAGKCGKQEELKDYFKE